MIVIPTFVLIFTTYKVKMLLNSTPPGSLSDERSKARAKRNKSITRMLIGIIVMFLICHTGKVCIMHASFYFQNSILFESTQYVNVSDRNLLLRSLFDAVS